MPRLSPHAHSSASAQGAMPCLPARHPWGTRLTSLLLGGLLAWGAPAASAAQSPKQVAATWWNQTGAKVGGTWSIALVGGPTTRLWGHGADIELPPASTLKMVTSVEVLRRLPPHHRLPTHWVSAGHVDPKGTWIGDWSLEFSGDWTLQQHSRHTLRQLADSLARRGVKRLTGPFQYRALPGLGAPLPTYPTNWGTRHRGQGYAPALGPTSIGGGTATVTITMPRKGAARIGSSVAHLGSAIRLSVKPHSSRSRIGMRWSGTTLQVSGTLKRGRSVTLTIPQHDRLLAALWRDATKAAGIEWNPVGAPREAPRSGPVVATIHSAPLATLLRDVNTRSFNLGAELLARYATIHPVSDPLTPGPPSAGGTILADGAGLSDRNRISAGVFARWWANVVHTPVGEHVLHVLPGSGQGTLRRLQAVPRDGLRAKTGTLAGVSALSGSFRGGDGVVYSFSFFYQGPNTTAARQAMYALCRSWGLDMAALPTEPSTTLPVGGLNLIADAELAAPDVPAEPGASGPADP